MEDLKKICDIAEDEELLIGNPYALAINSDGRLVLLDDIELKASSPSPPKTTARRSTLKRAIKKKRNNKQKTNVDSADAERIQIVPCRKSSRTLSLRSVVPIKRREKKKPTQPPIDFSSLQPTKPPPNVLQLCTSFAQGNCTNIHCVHMHSDFPCKYYYLNMAHDIAKCRYTHGPPLDDAMRAAFMHYLESRALDEFAAIESDNSLAKRFDERHRQLQVQFDLWDRRRLDLDCGLIWPHDEELAVVERPFLVNGVEEKFRLGGFDGCLAELGALTVAQIVQCQLDIGEIWQIVEMVKTMPTCKYISRSFSAASTQTVDPPKSTCEQMEIVKSETGDADAVTDVQPVALKSNNQIRRVLRATKLTTSLKVPKTEAYTILSPDDLDIKLDQVPTMPFHSVLSNFVAATEIDASYKHHSAIAVNYRLIPIHVPPPDMSLVQPKLNDPRLKRHPTNTTHRSPVRSSVNRRCYSPILSPDSSRTPEMDEIPLVADAIRSADPRRYSPILSPQFSPTPDWADKPPLAAFRPNNILNQPWKLLDKAIVHASRWYAALSPMQKIMANQQLAILKSELQTYHKHNARAARPRDSFDLSMVKQNRLLQQTLVCLGVFVNERGECQMVG